MHHGDDPRDVERMERETSDSILELLREHSGKDALSCGLCALAQEYRFLRQRALELVKVAREVAMTHKRYELDTLVDAAHLHLDDAVFELKRAMEPFEGE